MISFIITLLIWNWPVAVQGQLDPCEVYGKIYIESNPNYAHFRVYEDDSEAFADILIFEEENSLYADEVGHWSFVDDRDFADVYIYFEKDRYMADFAVYYTDYASFAGCNR
ncbi:DUF6150 family protein [Reichenbachiella carrageenanivorans]|uniref:DUF6150 family protein n=1 Tax=Reichenbachiella carrageenanivorans TaxID=2979869 RepID=A0ABY6D3S9_9BACT|nr:DUF6150 family protein [Reichenbachiella carrageenanivorans]UXX80559.1 DUF6150 family protein [Reichenbachiella carrageenanivorans]